MKREVFVDRQLLVPELRMVGWNSSRSAMDRSLAGHTHRGAFEVCCIHRGSVEWWANDEIHEVGPGDVYVTRPGERHGGVDAVIHPCDLYWAQVSMTGPGLRMLAGRYSAMTLRRFPGSPTVRACFERLLDEHRRPDALGPLAARAALHELLVTVARDHDAQVGRSREQAASPAIAAAIAWMSRRLGQDHAVGDAAAAAGLSVTRFHERFQQEVGFAPGEWRGRQRIRLAKALLRRPELSITDVAMRCGFATSQYFATAFKKMVGMTPGAYRRSVTREPG